MIDRAYYAVRMKIANARWIIAQCRIDKMGVWFFFPGNEIPQQGMALEIEQEYKLPE